MDTLIQKIDILHPTLMEVLKYHGPLFIFALIFVNIGSILIITLDLTATDFNRKKHYRYCHTINTDNINYNRNNIINRISQLP